MTAATVMDFLSSFATLILIFSSLVLYFAYRLRVNYSYWERRGVPYPKPTLFFGNIKDLVFWRVPITRAYDRIYKELQGHRFGGFYHMTQPCIMIRDPKLVKTVLVENFTNFHDRHPRNVDSKLDPLASNPFSLCGQRWKYCRTTAISTFSTEKLRKMEHLMKDCLVKLEEYLDNVTRAHSKTGDVQDVKELMTKLVTDVHVSCVGLKCNGMKDNGSDFRQIVRKLPHFRLHLRVLLRSAWPRLIDILKFKSTSHEVEGFFKSRIQQAVHDRESSGQKRNDVLQLIVDVQAEKKAQLLGHQQYDHQKDGHHQNGRQEDGTHVEKSWLYNKSGDKMSELLFSEDVFASLIFVFFLTGVESISSALSYCVFELALNPEICEKVKDEIERVKLAHDGLLDYNAMKELIYLDAVISETLRKYPITPLSERRCTESFKIPDSSVVIEKGTLINISIYSLHHDPKYFPEPEKFLPDRFSEENKGSIIPGSYIPFGDGPRICIAKRFVLLQMKLVLSHLVSKYAFHPCEKTVIPVKFTNRCLLNIPGGEIWVRFQKRSK